MDFIRKHHGSSYGPENTILKATNRAFPWKNKGKSRINFLSIALDGVP